jgi:ribosomal protein S18 acetylase RimI-like enzyme
LIFALVTTFRSTRRETGRESEDQRVRGVPGAPSGDIVRWVSIPYRVRLATVDDVAQLLQFWILAAENATRPDDDVSMVERLLARDPEALILAEAADDIIGSLISGWDGWRFHVYRLAVHPDWRGQGVGRRLLTEAETRCVAFGSRRIDAMVLNDNDLGGSFWRALGYHPQHEWRRWLKSVGE